MEIKHSGEPGALQDISETLCCFPDLLTMIQEWFIKSINDLGFLFFHLDLKYDDNTEKWLSLSFRKIQSNSISL